MDGRIEAAELASYVELAQDGDGDAANEVARAVWPWTRRTARAYSLVFYVDTDDLVSAGLSRLPLAIRTFHRHRSPSFLAYYGKSAAREMIKYGRSELSRRSILPVGIEEAEARPHPADSIVWDLLGRLKPQHRRIVSMANGLGPGGTTYSFGLIARRLKLRECTVRKKYVAAIQLLRRLANDDPRRN